MKITLILLAVMALAAGTQAQPRTREASNEQQSVANDDRGRAFVIERDSAPLSGLNNPGRSVISEPQQYSIFLGSGWATPALRAREAELGNLLVNVRDHATLKALNDSGVQNLYGPTSSREQFDHPAGNISDLEIQNILGAMIKDGSLPQSGANTIYVVFLDPEMRSTLGSMFAGKHYAAYHNFFNAGGMKLHYVVVPYEADRNTATRIAFRALVAAALNPTGATSN
ncbi:MAG TPA: hypothetical protein VEM96_16250 [Pyrinomonadaceae bacterium]|nr:hypothetical protein [Pyrinomonadaceae bacterium]